MGKSASKGVRLSGRAKFLVDFGPLFVFFVAYFFGHRLAPLAGHLFGRSWTLADGEELFLAMGAFMPAFAVAFLYSVWRERRVAPMLLVTGLVVGVLGGLAFVFHNRAFVYLKPTIVYLFFAIGLAGGLATGRNFLKTLFDGAFHMEEGAWRVLTKRYIVFFVVLAIANETAWRWLMRDCDLTAAVKCAGEPTWVNLKIWGFTSVNIVFAGLQAPFLAKHMRHEPPSETEQSPPTKLE